MDERKLKLYKTALEMGKITIDDVPEPYRSAIEKTPEA